MFTSAQARVRALLLAIGMGVLGLTAAHAATEWLAICSKCVNPSIFSKTGIGTDKALAQARITREAVKGWCENWQPDDKTCVKKQLEAEDLKKVYQAAASCPAGRITPVDGQTYTLAGVWEKGDVGTGRSRWRDASGKIVARDNASGGLGISQQWELLCPGSVPGAKSAVAPVHGAMAPSAAIRPPGLPAGAGKFVAGQTVMARYGTGWVRARVNKVVQKNGANGPQIHYDVSLENHKHGVVPERMLRSE